MNTHKTQIRCIFGDDEAVIDFLVDLKDKKPIQELQYFAKSMPNAALLYNCKPDNLVVLILYNSPFTLCKSCSALALYAHENLRGLLNHFQGWFDVSEDGTIVKQALNDIIRLLHHNLIEQWDKKQHQTDYLMSQGRAGVVCVPLSSFLFDVYVN